MKFYIRRIECWGGTYLFCVADSDTRCSVSPKVETRKAAEHRRDRMNADWERYRAVSWGRGGLPPRKTEDSPRAGEIPVPADRSTFR